MGYWDRLMAFYALVQIAPQLRIHAQAFGKPGNKEKVAEQIEYQLEFLKTGLVNDFIGDYDERKRREQQT